MVEVLLIDERGLKLCRKEVVIAHNWCLVGVLNVVKSLVTVLYDIRLVLDGVIGLWGAQKIQGMEMSLFSIHDKHLDTFHITAFIGVRDASKEWLSEINFFVSVWN